MPHPRENAGAVYRRSLVVILRKTSERGDVDERGHARPGPHPRQNAAEHRPRRILQPQLATNPERGENLVENSVFGGIEHELPQKRHHQRARKMRKKVKKAEKHLAARNFTEHNRQHDRNDKPDEQRYDDIFKRPQPRLPE